MTIQLGDKVRLTSRRGRPAGNALGTVVAYETLPGGRPAVRVAAGQRGVVTTVWAVDRLEVIATLGCDQEVVR